MFLQAQLARSDFLRRSEQEATETEPDVIFANRSCERGQKVGDWETGRETSFSCPLPRLVGSVGPSEASFVWVRAAVLLQWTWGNTHISLYDSCLIELRTKTHWTSRLCMNVVWYSWTESCTKTKTIIKTDWQNAFVSLKQHAHNTHMSNKFLCGHQLQLRNHWLQLDQRLATRQ